MRVVSLYNLGMSSLELRPQINPNSFSYFVGHDPSSTQKERVFCINRMKELFDGKIRLNEKPQFFFKTENDIFSFIETLPRESENISINPFLGESHTIVTRENVGCMWNFWRASMDLRSNLESIYGDSNTQIRRFSLNLGYLIALNTFIRSNDTHLLTFEDDALLREDFIEVLNTILVQLPFGWDVFNFVTKDGVENFRNDLQLLGTNLAVCYQNGSSAGLLWSRKGARAVLNRLLIEFRNFEYGDPNGDMNIDALICNLQMQRTLVGPQISFSKNFSHSRPFQSYTFIPNFSSPVEQRALESTWR
jgi:hypothetical protein